MKSKILKIVYPVIFISIASFMLLFFYDVKPFEIVFILLFGLAAGILILIFRGYYIPSQRIFKIRFWIYSFLFGIWLFLLALISNWSAAKTYEGNKLIYSLIAQIISGTLIIWPFIYWRYKFVCKRTKLEKHQGELEILSDFATIETLRITTSGRIILTTERLCFISSEKNRKQFDFYFADLIQGIKTTKHLGIPNGISIIGKGTKITMIFTSLWEKEITKMIKEKAT